MKCKRFMFNWTSLAKVSSHEFKIFYEILSKSWQLITSSITWAHFSIVWIENLNSRYRDSYRHFVANTQLNKDFGRVIWARYGKAVFNRRNGIALNFSSLNWWVEHELLTMMVVYLKAAYSWFCRRRSL